MGNLGWSVVGCLVAGALLACDNGSTEPSSPLTGTLSVTATTTGTDFDPDGYIVSVDRKSSQRIGANSSVSLPGVSAGKHMVWLDRIAPNCWAVGPNPVAVTIPLGSTTSAEFGVACTTPNTVLISTLTTGTNAPDSVTANLMGRQRVCGPYLCLSLPVVLQRVQLPVNGTVQLPITVIGYSGVTLTVPSNCSATDRSPPQNPIVPGGVARWYFVITCQ
jgi:hypothetical protein